MSKSFGFRQRAKAFAVHALISAAVAGVAAMLVFGLWYPSQFRSLAGGDNLFFLVISVDVVLGPLLTFSVFNPSKGFRQLRWDLAVIGLLQIAGLAYGMHVVYIARPVAMVFEVDRLRLVTANAVDMSELPKALPQYRQLPLDGPLLLGTRQPKAGEEHTDALFQGLAGNDIGVRPIFWQPYERSIPDVLARAKPLQQLLNHYPAQGADLQQRLKDMHADVSSSRFLPTQARGPWAVVLDPQGHILGYLPVDGFI